MPGLAASPDGAAAPASGVNPELFRLAVEACPGGILAVSGTGVIVMVNREIERLFGYERDELLGQSVDILLPEKLRGRHAGLRTGFMKHPDARHMGARRDFNGRHKDGTEFAIEVGLSPIRTGNRDDGALRHHRYQRTQAAGTIAGRIRVHGEPRIAHADDIDCRLARPPDRRRRRRPACPGHAPGYDCL